MDCPGGAAGVGSKGTRPAVEDRCKTRDASSDRGRESMSQSKMKARKRCERRTAKDEVSLPSASEGYVVENVKER